MSWWVNDYIAVSEDETQQLCNIQADAVSDLPAQDQTATAGFSFVRGSKAYVLDTSGQYIMNSSGQWILQKSGQEIEIGADDIIYDNTSSGMTATNVQDAIDEIKDLDDMQDRALTELYADSANQQLEINYAINTGAKNFLDVQHPTTTTRTSYTPLANGGVELSCSSAIWTSYNIADIPVEAGKEYIITFLLDESSGTSNFYFFLRNDNSSGTNLATKNYGSTTGIYEASFTPNTSVIWLGIYLNNSATAATATAKLRCMLRPASIKDPTFEPYAKTNVELTGENASQQAEIDYAVNTGAKNLLKITASSQTHKGVTFTVNDDQTVTVNGTNDGTGASTFVIVPNAQAITIPDGNYILSGCPTGGGATAPFDLRWYMYSPGKSAYEVGNGASIEKSGNGTGSNIAIVVKTGQTANNLIFKPMLRPAEITDSTYVPYAPTNRELYELCDTKASLTDIYGLKPTISNGTDLNNLTAGCMTCPGATVAATLINCPTTTDAFIIYTDYLAATSRAIQRIYSFSTTTGIPAQYMRVRWSQGWTPWYQVTMQQVASASTQSVNQVSTLNLSRNDLNESLDTDIESFDSITEEESESYNTDEELTKDESE